MPAKRMQLISDLEITTHFRVFGIETHLPDYKLTLRLNQKLRWRMRRMQGFRIFGGKPGAFEDFTLYHYEWNTFAGLFLVNPISQINTLLPFSYFIIRGGLLPQQEKLMLAMIESVEGVDKIHSIDLYSGQLSPSYRNWLIHLLIDLEFHICERLKPSANLQETEVL
jgi:hypothetical protein